MSLPSTYEVQARHAKVMKLVHWIRSHTSITADEARQAIEDDESWRLLAKAAGTNVPSPESREDVIWELRLAEKKGERK